MLLNKSLLVVVLVLGAVAAQALLPDGASADPGGGGLLGGLGDVPTDVTTDATNTTGGIVDGLTTSGVEGQTGEAANEQLLPGLTPNVGEVVEPIGEELAPLTEVAAEAIAPITTGLGDPLTPSTETAAQALTPATTGLGDALTPVTEIASHTLAPATEALGPVLAPLAAPAGDLVELLDPLVGPVMTTAGNAVEALTPVLGPVTEALQPVLEPLREVVDPLTAALDPVLAPVGQAAQTVLTPVTDSLQPVTGPLTDAVDTVTAPVIEVIQLALPPVGDLPAPFEPVPDPVVPDPILDETSPDPIVGPPASSPELPPPETPAGAPGVTSPGVLAGLSLNGGSLRLQPGSIEGFPTGSGWPTVAEASAPGGTSPFAIGRFDHEFTAPPSRVVINSLDVPTPGIVPLDADLSQPAAPFGAAVASPDAVPVTGSTLTQVTASSSSGNHTGPRFDWPSASLPLGLIGLLALGAWLLLAAAETSPRSLQLRPYTPPA